MTALPPPCFRTSSGQLSLPGPTLPPGVHVHAGFLTPTAARGLEQHCLHALPWSRPSVTLFGRSTPIPRRVAWLAPAGCSYRYSGIRHVGAGVPEFLSQLLEAVRDAVGVAFDSVLASHYRDGGDRLGWHADDEAELGPDPALAIVSLGAARVLRFRRRDAAGGRRTSLALTLTSGSLLYMAPGVQRDWQHCLPARKRAASRISLGLRQLETTCDAADAACLPGSTR